jgi:hypothetical protein
MATTTNNIFSKEDVLYLKQYINFDDAFHLNFCRSQGKIFYDNIKDISYIYELNHCNVFNRIQKFHLDELVIFLSKWGRNYDYLNLINDSKIRSILPITKEKYGKDYDFFEVVEALILCGSPTILIADCNDDNEMISQIATTRLLSEIYDIPIFITLQLAHTETLLERCLMYSKIVDIIWLNDTNIDISTAVSVSKNILGKFPDKILGYKYFPEDHNTNKILSNSGYKFSNIESGRLPTARSKLN